MIILPRSPGGAQARARDRARVSRILRDKLHTRQHFCRYRIVYALATLRPGRVKIDAVTHRHMAHMLHAANQTCPPPVMIIRRAQPAWMNHKRLTVTAGQRYISANSAALRAILNPAPAFAVIQISVNIVCGLLPALATRQQATH